MAAGVLAVDDRTLTAGVVLLMLLTCISGDGDDVARREPFSGVDRQRLSKCNAINEQFDHPVTSGMPTEMAISFPGLA